MAAAYASAPYGLWIASQPDSASVSSVRNRLFTRPIAYYDHLCYYWLYYCCYHHSQQLAGFFLAFSRSSSVRAPLCEARLRVPLCSGFSRVCARLCLTKLLDCDAAYSHRGNSHLYGLAPVCLCLCLVKSLFLADVYSQPGKSHLYGLSFVCLRLWLAKALR